MAVSVLPSQGDCHRFLERQRDTRPHGHALVTQPAAVRALEDLKEAHNAFSSIGVDVGALHWWSYKGIMPIAVQLPTGKSSRAERRFQTDRSSLLFGKNVQGVEDGPRNSWLWTGDGEYSTDLVIAADGVLQPITNEKETISQLAQGARLAPWLEPGTKHGVLGSDRFVFSRFVNNGILGVLFNDVDHAGSGPVDGNWNTPVDVDALRTRFSDFKVTTRAFLDHVQHAEKWQMATGPELDTWWSASGRVVLLGDAAHAMLPHAARGLSEGIEDAISLSHMLRWATKSGVDRVDTPAVTDAWVNLPKPRVDIFMK
ncbi:hypothetical protein ETB97_001545 [Aspergillus alliaceus]|uniref:FAD-binding domain-containing protein n=1 Tax=Petromyces alliaceus TaxID=209559 RepID=A0A8H6EAW3_PETAA|nr:hypothetical protein ETB97_001545 [Aspergillus burnettii]